MLKFFAISGTWIGKSLAEPPHIITTSILSFQFIISLFGRTGTEEFTVIVLGSLLVNIATNSISFNLDISDSIPFPKFPYP